MKNRPCAYLTGWMFLWLPTLLSAQAIDSPTAPFLMHYGGNHLAKGTQGGAVLEAADVSSPHKLTFIPSGNGYYALQSSDNQGYLPQEGQWNTSLMTDSSSAKAPFPIGNSRKSFIKRRYKHDGKGLGTEGMEPSSAVYLDKDGTDTRHLWYLAPDTSVYVINPTSTRQEFEGWGISLCWWANVCGKWSDEKIDELVDWLVSPDGLNYRIFRYNIGGGDDPQNRNCTPHHMGRGKGLRAEMEGFKDSPDGEYVWGRDAAQRKIMLKIKERRPDAIFEAFSNSCPYYMTYSGCCAGHTDASADNLRPEYYEAFARYLVDVCKHYKEEYGIEFRTLSPFNEPMTSYWGANGGQEGCHFDIASQAAFLKVLEPILKTSGLNTVISASEETDAAQSVRDFEGYREAGVLPLVGQWNTHTYSATNQSRSQINALCNEYGIRLWMSEVGSGGNGISGNLNMAQKLMDDIRYIMPVAWVDWQYMEEGNDQWCLVQGDFTRQTYHKVKNYTIRQHFSKFIRPGYTFLTSLNAQTLAARNPEGDSLIIVAVNPGASPLVHRADLNFYETISSELRAFRTSETEDLSPTADYTLENRILTYELPAYSIVTFVIPVKEAEDADNSVRPGLLYWVCPRNTADQALQASDGKVTLQPLSYSPEQAWKLRSDGDGYTFTNGNGNTLTGHLPDYPLGYEPSPHAGQIFSLTPIDRLFYKITTEDGEKSFDLEGEHLTAGTTVGLWEYGSSPTACHRQWLFMRQPDSGSPDAIPPVSFPDGTSRPLIRLTCEPGCILWVDKLSDTPCILGIHTPAGICIYRTSLQDETMRIPLRPGVYIVSGASRSAHFHQTISIK